MSYQRDELHYHKNEDNWKLLNRLTNRAYNNRLFISHLSNIIYLPKHTSIAFDANEKIALINISNSINGIIQKEALHVKKSIATLKSSVKQMDEFDQNQMKSTLIYEILLIYKILDSRYAK